MRVHKDKLSSVVNYLAGFGDSESNVLFTPLNDGLVLASVDTGVNYAQYSFAPDAPLQERFAVRLQVLRDVAEVAPDGLIEYRLGSQAIFSVHRTNWWLPMVSLGMIQPRPEWVVEQRVIWDGSLLKWLGIMRETALRRDASSCLDCVMLDTRANTRVIVDPDTDEERIVKQTPHRLLVASDMATMVTYRDKDADCDSTASLLIDRRAIPQIMATCESGSRIEIRIGVSQYSVTCGRRMATFGIRSGLFPKGWIPAMRDSSGRPTRGKVLINRKHLGDVTRQAKVASNAIRLSQRRNEGISLRCAYDESRSEQRVAVPVDGRFGPVNLKAEFLERIAKHWPEDELSLEYQGTDHPIVVRSATAKNLTGLLNPIRFQFEEYKIDEWGEEESVQRGSGAGGIRHGETGEHIRPHQDEGGRQGFCTHAAMPDDACSPRLF